MPSNDRSTEMEAVIDRHMSNRLGVDLTISTSRQQLKDDLQWISFHRKEEIRRKENRTRLYWALLIAVGGSAVARMVELGWAALRIGSP